MTAFGFANNNDSETLKELWGRSFGDSDEYIDLFLERRFSPENTPVCRCGDVVASQLFLLEGNLELNSRNLSAYYIYAACTEESLRSRGYMSSLIDFAAQTVRERKRDLLCLLPGEASLFDYYSRFGFKDCFVKYRYHFSKSELNAIAVGGDNNFGFDDSEKIFKIRSDKLKPFNAFVWDKNAVDYAVTENAFSGGVSVNGEDFYAIISSGEDCWHISEFIGDERAFEKLAGYLMTLPQFDSFVLDSPFLLDLGFEFNSVSGGMILPLSDKCKDLISKVSQCYLGLTLE